MHMLVNLHTHTPRCNHAKGTEREYIERAIEGGFHTLGFSDHAPMPFDGGYYSNFRMRPEQFDDYMTTLIDLREEYKRDIRLLIGLEAEYYPRYFNRLIDMVSPYPLDYLILGQHFIGNEHDATYSGNPLNTEAELARYVDQTAEGLATGRFTYFAHPDLIRFLGADAVYEKHMRRLCENAKALDIPLEINLLGVHTHRAYPCERFFRIAAEVGNTIVLGSDAHSPHDTFRPETIEQAHAFARNLGLNPTEDIRIRNPFLR